MSESPEYASPSAKERLAAASFYCGLLPIMRLLGKREEGSYEGVHFVQALALYFVLLVIIVTYLCISVFLSYMLVFHRGSYEGSPLEPTLLMIVRRMFLCWLPVWGFATYWALRGSWHPLPLVGRLAKYPKVLAVSFVGNVVLILVVVTVAASTAHASVLTRTDGEPADAYMLYDDMGLVPHWVFRLGFYPIARASKAKWGADRTVVAPLTKEALAEALRTGTFVFILSHGTEEGLYTAKFKIRPRDAAPLGVGEKLQFVYLTGCDSGTLAREWERTLAPAEVVTFDRLSAWLEHIYWLLFRGADAVRKLE